MPGDGLVVIAASRDRSQRPPRVSPGCWHSVSSLSTSTGPRPASRPHHVSSQRQPAGGCPNRVGHCGGRRAVWAVCLPARSACATVAVLATGLSLRSPRAGRDLFLSAGGYRCPASPALSFCPRENIFPARVGRWCGPRHGGACRPDRREARTSSGRPAQAATKGQLHDH
jgi:hypothetical protein